MRAVVAVALVAAVVAAGAVGGRSASSANCGRTSTGFVPLTDLERGTYQGYRGGLYAAGRNQPLAKFRRKGLAYAKRVRPIDGKIVLLSIGMSNATQEYRVFMRDAAAEPRKNPRLVLVDGAQGGQDAETISSPTAAYWTNVDRRLAAAGVTARQVEAVWLKEAIARPTEAFPADAKRLQADLRAIDGILRRRFPNLQLVFVSSRTYGGYASTSQNPEPYAYESGFAVKWFVQDRIAGRLRGPWVQWGPYLWTDGTRGRSDGLVWTCADVRADGTHPSDGGAEKVSQLLLHFFETDATAKRWFLG